jgi:hypothetical protein
MHWEGVQTAYIAAGNKTSDADVKADSTTVSRLFLSEILVDMSWRMLVDSGLFPTTPSIIPPASRSVSLLMLRLVT